MASVQFLEMFPKYGRPGQVPGTRELIVYDLPYIVVYLETDTEIEIIAVFHGAQNRST